MIESQTVINRIVKRFLNEQGLTQVELAHALDISAATLNRRLSGIRSWSVDDLDALAGLGVPVQVPFEVVAGDRA